MKPLNYREIEKKNDKWMMQDDPNTLVTDITVDYAVVTLPGYGPRVMTTARLNSTQGAILGIAYHCPTDRYDPEVGSALALARAFKTYSKYLKELAYEKMMENEKAREATAYANAQARRANKAARVMLKNPEKEASHWLRLTQALKEYKIYACDCEGRYFSNRDYGQEGYSPIKQACPHCEKELQNKTWRARTKEAYGEIMKRPSKA